MNTTEEVDDDSAGCGILCCLVFCEHPVCEQNAEARARVSFKHVHDGLAGCLDLLSTDRCEDTVVNSVVEEQDLGRLDKDCGQREKVVLDKNINTCGQNCEDCCHERADYIVAEDCDQHTDDTY